MSSPQKPTESILVFSDVHLGSDLNDRGPVLPRSPSVDRDLAGMLAHYRAQKPPADRWRFVIAGDFIDFVGMSIDPRDDEAIVTELTAEERRNGVGSAEDHARLKLRRVARRHAEVFEELGKLVAGGHTLTILHGNHDIELHWPAVRDDLRAIIVGTCPAEQHARARERIEFEPWFFYREGVVYIEHGHQYDPFCATAFILAPISPRDPRRVERGYSETLLRAIVRRTPGLKEYGHEHRGLGSYVAWAFTLGLRGMIGLWTRFFVAIFELTKTQRAYRTERARVMRREHDARIVERGERGPVDVARLHELLALQSRPIGSTFRGVLASVMLDRLLLYVAVGLAFAVIGVLVRLGPLAGHGLHAAGVVCVIWVGLHFHLAARRGSVDPTAQQSSRAAHIAKVFAAPYVLMGHTHKPLSMRAGEATYINVGSWAEEDDPTSKYRAARTHVVIHERDGKPEACFYEWVSGDGPRLRS